MPVSTTLYPYNVSHELHLRPFDPYDPTHEDLKFGWLERGGDEFSFQKLDLTGHEGWRSLRFQLDANLPRDEMEEILAASSDWEDDVSLVVSVLCRSTKFRRAVELTPGEPFTWNGDLTIHRSQVRSVVELQSALVRKTTIPPSEDGSHQDKAAMRGAVVATAPSLRLYVDETERPIRGALDIRWDDFSDSEDSWRKSRRSDLSSFDSGGEEPTLWLNSWYQSFKATLERSESKGVEAALRHLLNSMLAQTTWMQLFMTAAGQMASAEEPGEEMLEGWQQDVLANFLPRMFPDAQTDEDRREQLAEILRSPDQLASLMSRLGAATQEVVGTATLFEKAIRAVEEEFER